MLIYGSGVITVLAENSTRFPIKLLLTLPVFPLIPSLIDLITLLPVLNSVLGNVAVLLSKYGAISSNVLDYGNHKMIYIILQLGQYSDSNTK